MAKIEWKNVSEKLPTKEGYYTVMYEDETTDRKPFRIRPTKNINGFMSEREIIKWK